MHTNNRLYRALSILFAIALIVPPAAVRAGTDQSMQETYSSRLQKATDPGVSGLYRTTITVRNSIDWRLLDEMGVVILERGDDSGVLLVDDEQLTTLARLQMRPQASDVPVPAGSPGRLRSSRCAGAASGRTGRGLTGCR